MIIPMVNTILYAILSVVVVSLVSFVGVVTLVLSRKVLSNTLLFLVSLSAGTLFGGAFLHLLPDAVEKSGFNMTVGLSVLGGILVFFILEKFIHHHSGKHKEHKHEFPLLHEPHKHHIGVMNLVGDGVHNFIDGLVIAGAYLVSIPLGIATTLAVVMHEVPQEIGDFGVLLYAGYSVGRALFFNFLSAAVAILGTIAGLMLGTDGGHYIAFILPFAAGGFIYIAGSNLIPELHKECSWKESVWHVVTFIFGMAIMVALLYF